MHVVSGERYSAFSKETKALLHGEYGRLPGQVNEEVKRKALGDAEVVACHPADLIPDEMERYK